MAKNVPLKLQALPETIIIFHNLFIKNEIIFLSIPKNWDIPININDNFIKIQKQSSPPTSPSTKSYL